MDPSALFSTPSRSYPGLETCLRTNYGPIRAVDRLRGGIENDVFHVTFTSGIDAVAHVYRAKTMRQVEGEVQLLRLIHGRVRCAALIEPARAKNPLIVEGHPMTLIEFVKGKHIDRARYTAGMLGQIASSLSDLHEISRGRCLRTYWGLAELLHKGQMLLQDFSGRPGDRGLRDVLIRELAVVQSLDADPAENVMIHADVDEGNLLLNEAGELWLVDFDDCGYAPAALDVAIALRNLALKRHLRDGDAPGLSIYEAAAALLEGYRPALAKLGTWTRVACFRHALLMLENSFLNVLYPSKNSENFSMLEAARALEHDLNAMSA